MMTSHAEAVLKSAVEQLPCNGRTPLDLHHWAERAETNTLRRSGKSIQPEKCILISAGYRNDVTSIPVPKRYFNESTVA